MAQKLLPSSSSFIVIRKQVVQKEKLLGDSLKIQKRKSDDNRKNTERERSLNYERKLESSLSFLGKGIRVPHIRGLGFFAAIKRFITNTLLGFITIRLLKYLPQLIETFNLVLKVSDFIITTSGKLLNALVSFVDWGYRAYDSSIGFIKNISGEKAVTDLDLATDQINKTLNTLFIAGMLFSDFGSVGTIGGRASKDINQGINFIKENVGTQAAQRGAQAALPAAGGTTASVGGAAATTGGIAAGTAASIVAGAGLLASAVGEGAFQIKKFGKRFGNWLGVKVQEANRDRNPITRFLKKGLFNWMKFTLGPALWVVNGIGTTLDVIGAPFRYGIELIRFGVMKLQNNQKGLEEQAKNLRKFDARIRDGVREQYAFLAPLFRMMGLKGFSEKLETPGSFGSLYGERAAKDMGYYGGGSVKVKKFAGGGYTGDYSDSPSNISRTFQKTSRQLSPGSSVGGEKIFEIFPEPKDKDKVMNPYGYITDSYSSLSGSGSLGPIMEVMIRTILGDKVDSTDYSNVASSLSNLLVNGLYSENPDSYQRLVSVIGNDKLTSLIEGSIVRNLNDRMNSIQNELRVQLGLLPLPGGTEPTADECAPCEGGMNAAVSGDAADRAVLDLIASVESDGYDSVNTSAAASIGRPTQMTIEEIGRRGRGATGRYQHMPEYLVERARAAGVSPSEKFTPENQDKITLHFLRTGHGLDRWKSGQMSDREFAQRLSRTWRGLPYDERNQTYPDRYASRNKAHTTFANVLQSLQRAKTGGATAKVAPGSSAASVDHSCVCDPQTPDVSGIGNVVPAGETKGRMISGYPITSGFGMRWHPVYGGYKKHGGIDIGVPSGKPIALTVDGIAGPPPQYQRGYGNFIDIKVPSLNLYFRFAHLIRPPNFKPGQKIPAGKTFGNVGSTGTSTGPHIHFEANTTISGYGGDRDPTPYGKYISIGRFVGGSTLSGGPMKLHKGEYVIDKDSVDIFGGMKFFDIINKVENESQRSSASRSLIQHLSQYTGRKIDQRPTIIVENDDEILMMPPTYQLNTSISGDDYSEEVDWELDMCYARG